MAPGQAGDRQVELALLVTIVKVHLPNDRVPLPAARQPQGAGCACHLADPAGNRRRIELRHQRHAAFRDRGLFACDAGEPGAKELLVIEGQIGNASHQRALDHVRCVEAAAEAHFEDAGVRRSAREREQRCSRRDLEEARLNSASGIDDLAE